MIEIYDTTLRDGTQRDGLSLSVDDKIRIARRLDDLGVSFIEGGWPGSNPKDAAFFELAANMRWKTTRIAAFGATRRVGCDADEDANLRALIAAQTPVCTVVGKTWSLHVTDVLRTTLEDNLALIEDSLAYLRSHNRHVIYDAEHFFDGYADNAEYALETLRAAVRGGAHTVVLCDTNGGSMPWDVERIVREVTGAVDCAVGIHVHNDGECGVANSLAAVRGGASHVQGTINGYGERCGNANLCAIIPNLELKLGRRCVPAGGLGQLYEVSHLVSEIANLAPDEHMAYVGRSAFAHKGGIHVAAMRRNEKSYQHIDPEIVGNRMRVVVSELSGRGNLLSKAEELGVEAGEAGDVSEVLQEIKSLEARGFSFEAAEASVALMLVRRSADYQPPYRLVDYMVNVEHRRGRGNFAEATVKVEVGGDVFHTAAEGDGPVDALAGALRKALEPVYPDVARFHLIDYKVRILDGHAGTAATTRVLIDTSDGHDTWGTVGASTNIIEASWRALTDAVEYGLTMRPSQAANASAAESESAETVELRRPLASGESR